MTRPRTSHAVCLFAGLAAGAALAKGVPVPAVALYAVYGLAIALAAGELVGRVAVAAHYARLAWTERGSVARVQRLEREARRVARWQARLQDITPDTPVAEMDVRAVLRDATAGAHRAGRDVEVPWDARP